jgi:hypothetical protein
VIETFGGQPGVHSVLYLKHRKRMLIVYNVQPIPPAIKAVVSQLTKAQNDKALKAACEEYKAALFIRIANESRYGVIMKKLDNMYLFDQEAYPKTLEQAYNYLTNYQVESGGFRQQNRSIGQDGVSFVQQSNGQRRRGPCFQCGEFGHIAAECDKLSPDEKKKIVQATKGAQSHVNVGGNEDVNRANKELQECLDGVANTHVTLDDFSIQSIDGDEEYVDSVAFYNTTMHSDGVTLHSVEGAKGRFDCGRNKLFLDSCATQHTMFAPEYLTGRHTSNVYLRQNCNAGSKITNQCGYYVGLKFCNAGSKITNQCGYYDGLKFYIGEGGIANLLSVPALEKSGWKVLMETGKPVWALSPEGVLFAFKRDVGMTGGMPYLDMNCPKEHISRIVPKESVACIETVHSNMQGFTLEQCTKAKGVRDAMAMMAHPPEAKMKHMVSSNNVLNIPFTSTDFANGRALFGPDRGAIRGKTVRQRPHKVRPELIEIPHELYERTRDVILTADVMFVDGLPFL